MKSLACCSLLILYSAMATAQSYAQKFAVLSDLNDTVKMKSLLQKWNRADPGDPELYVAGMNYYLKSKSGHAIDSAISFAQRGISRFPNRLDLRFGKIFILGEASRYTDFSNEVIATLDYGHSIKNEWLWADDKKVEARHGND